MTHEQLTPTKLFFSEIILVPFVLVVLYVLCF